jgi:DNA topoisomerase-3
LEAHSAAFIEIPGESHVAKTLIIAEKPSVAADIAKVVGATKKTQTAWTGDTHVVSWAVGHLLEFVQPQWYDKKFEKWRLKDLPILPEKFKTEPVRGHKRQLNALKKFLNAKDVERVVNACDAGREGELIFQEIYRWSGSDKPVDRLWLQSMTAASITASLAAPRKGSDVSGLADAADCRAESDWLIGYNATRALTIRLRSSRDKNVWSAGRVQTATLALLVNREKTILSHIPEDYWLVSANFTTVQKPHEYVGNWFDPKQDGPKDRIHDPAVRDRIVAALGSGAAARASETRKSSKEKAPPLFDLTSLQREANRRFGLAARTTLRCAQALYEGHKLLTYPRTDSKALPSDYRPHVQNALQFLTADAGFRPHAQNLLSNGLNNEKRNFNDAAISDHFAIVPTGQGDPSILTGSDKKIWDLVARRFLAAFHPPAEWSEVERITTVTEERFRTRQRVLEVPGWRAVWERKDKETKPELPALAEPKGTDSVIGEHIVEAKETKPPSRYTEAALLGLMESAGKVLDDAALARVMKETGGLGTPATRADTIETLLNREYASRIRGVDNRKALRATSRGIRLVDALERIQLPRLTSAELTASLEESLKKVEEGDAKREKYMGEIRDWTTEIVERVRDFSYDELYLTEGILGTCPLCKTDVRETLRTYSCANGGIDGKCAFVVWKEIGGRYIERVSATQLLANGGTAPKGGFFTRDGQEYEASLHLTEDARVEVRSKDRGDLLEESSEKVEPADVGPCPFHEDKLIRRSRRGYLCDGVDDKTCKVKLPLKVCKRLMSLEEIQALTGKERHTELIEDFTSKRGRPFAATLHLTDAGRIRFEFPPRGTRRAGPELKKFPVNPEPICKDPHYKKAQIIESETQFVSTNPESKIAVQREWSNRELTRDEAKTLFEKGKTPLLEGFVSKKTGKPFTAHLKLQKSGKVKYDFPS